MEDFGEEAESAEELEKNVNAASRDGHVDESTLNELRNQLRKGASACFILKSVEINANAFL